VNAARSFCYLTCNFYWCRPSPLVAFQMTAISEFIIVSHIRQFLVHYRTVEAATVTRYLV